MDQDMTQAGQGQMYYIMCHSSDTILTFDLDLKTYLYKIDHSYSLNAVTCPDSHSLEAEKVKDRQQEHQESVEKQTHAIERKIKTVRI